MQPAAASSHRQNRVRYWNGYARKRLARFYHAALERIYRFQVPSGLRVLEIGCGSGDLLAALRPSFGVGVDFSPVSIQAASRRHPGLHFVLADAHALPVAGEFGCIVLSDLVNDLWDVQRVFREIRRLATPHTRVIINAYSRVWELPLKLSHSLGLANPVLGQNWLTVEDLANMLYLEDFEVIRHWSELLWPLGTPLVQTLANRYLVRLWPFRLAALANFLIARACPDPRSNQHYNTSVVVPARDEAGNIDQIFARVPAMGRGTELIFVEGHSSDGTYQAIRDAMGRYRDYPAKLYRQTGKGKGDAARLGFSQAHGDILMILDADLTVPPEDLPRFYEAIRSGKGEFVNGVRLVYPLEQRAMRFFNLVGNKFFSLAFSWLLGQPIKDTLCGTKALWREHYELIVANRSYFGEFDPFGDFDLLFGAAKLNLKIVDLPVRYGERKYGSTNIRRWKHGLLLARMVLFATRRIKFV